LLTELFL